MSASEVLFLIGHTSSAASIVQTYKLGCFLGRQSVPLATILTLLVVS